MTKEQRFGGSWTEEKLQRLRKYLDAYRVIFTRNPLAAKLSTAYVDAFAGTGYRVDERVAPAEEAEGEIALFGTTDAIDEAVGAYKKGSAVIALETEPPFDRYIFIERDTARAEQLQRLREAFPDRADRIVVRGEDANAFLQRWCRETDWRNWRAVVFLDPYGMQVEWSTIRSIAETRGIDLWILFPIGQAVIRMLPRHAMPNPAWSDRLTRFFGTEEWKSAFYKTSPQQSLFESEEQTIERDADFESINEFFVSRLESVFPGVARNPLVLRNSRGTPIYLLHFAAANPKGAPTAVKIARDILGK